MKLFELELKIQARFCDEESAETASCLLLEQLEGFVLESKIEDSCFRVHEVHGSEEE